MKTLRQDHPSWTDNGTAVMVFQYGWFSAKSQSNRWISPGWLNHIFTTIWWRRGQCLIADTFSFQIKSSVITAVYQKTLSLSTTAGRGFTSGEILNFMSTDADRYGKISWNVGFAIEPPFSLSAIACASISDAVAQWYWFRPSMGRLQVRVRIAAGLYWPEVKRRRIAPSRCLNCRFAMFWVWHDDPQIEIIKINHQFSWPLLIPKTRALLLLVWWGSTNFSSVCSHLLSHISFRHGRWRKSFLLFSETTVNLNFVLQSVYSINTATRDFCT